MSLTFTIAEGRVADAMARGEMTLGTLLIELAVAVPGDKVLAETLLRGMDDAIEFARQAGRADLAKFLGDVQRFAVELQYQAEGASV